MRKFEMLSNKELAILNKVILESVISEKIETDECLKELHEEIAEKIIAREERST